MEWIAFTLLAALMQAVRTAGQKQLTHSMSAIVATWARYGFGFPVAIIYFILIWQGQFMALTEFTLSFYTIVLSAALFQLAATLLLVKVLSLRNFAVGTTFAKTEGIFAAIIGALIFSTTLSLLAWLAILIGVTGLVFVSLKKSSIHVKSFWNNKTFILGILAGVFFALTSLLLREASLVSVVNPIMTAAYVLMLSLGIQGLICSGLVHWQDSQNWKQLHGQANTILFVGLTGTLGSIGWYTAFSYQDAAIVKAFGQIEYIATLALTHYFFRESISRMEWLGIISVLFSVVLLLVGV
ncbi:EamA family transporter [Reinekea marina]|uniref:EamA family transporter n=2 Tax=Reinekea marina TaxID=1310421 RepID=A0ABV7WNI0_9GAMM